MPQVTRHASAIDFLQVAETALVREEIANNLILGVPFRLRDHREDDSPNNLYLTVEDGGRLAGAIVMTPPHNLIVHVEGDADGDQAIDALVDAVIAARVTPPAIIGLTPTSARFAQRFGERTGLSIALETGERIFALREVVPPTPSPGRLRQGDAADHGIAAQMLAAFFQEAMPNEANGDAAERAATALKEGRLHFWEVADGDGWRIVSLVGTSRALAHGRTIGPVYTPPSERGKGYASNATAALSTLLLAQGWEYTTLFTDLANPTSNKIYQAIGYRPVCDYEVWKAG